MYRTFIPGHLYTTLTNKCRKRTKIWRSLFVSVTLKVPRRRPLPARVVSPIQPSRGQLVSIHNTHNCDHSQAIRTLHSHIYNTFLEDDLVYLSSCNTLREYTRAPSTLVSNEMHCVINRRCDAFVPVLAGDSKRGAIYKAEFPVFRRFPWGFLAFFVPL